jgi:hypothetical protein
MVHPEDTTGICDRVAGQIFMAAPDLSKIEVTYEDDASTTIHCDDPTAATPGEVDVGKDRVSIAIEHNLPALTPLIRVSFDIDVLARRTISAQPEV